jgi:hypothetical protein
MGEIDKDNLLTVILINGLGDQFPQLQSSIQTMTLQLGFSSETVIRQIHEENMLIKRRIEQGLVPHSTSSTALSVTSRECLTSRTICSNCKHPGHSIDFCIRHRGKLFGRSFDEARTIHETSS